ncbi:MAG: sigma-70 family RNA polymerase sigma factor [Gammaproteobacteria bacterium PRO9]|nr:sigma-70 family RNA polymerase sigma factor [Gammaproteobacteria bacterium PRO9]
MAERSDDAQLMARFAGGDAAAFETLYARYRGPLYRYFLRQCNHADAADELYEEVWMRVIGARTRHDQKTRFNTWLYQIAHNRLTEHFRKSGRDLTRDSAPVDGASDTAEPAGGEAVDPAFASARWSLVDWEAPAGAGEDSGSDSPAGMSAEQRAERLRMALDALPIEQREAFVLHEEARLGLDEIATVTGSNAATIRGRLRHAVAKLQAATSGSAGGRS